MKQNGVTIILVITYVLYLSYLGSLVADHNPFVSMNNQSYLSFGTRKTFDLILMYRPEKER